MRRFGHVFGYGYGRGHGTGTLGLTAWCARCGPRPIRKLERSANAEVTTAGYRPHNGRMTPDSFCFQLLLATFAGWVNRQQSQVIDYLVEENRVLKEQMKGRALRRR